MLMMEIRRCYWLSLTQKRENSAYGTANVYMTTTYKNYYANDGDCKKTNQHNPDYINNGSEGSFAQVFWQANGGKWSRTCSSLPEEHFVCTIIKEWENKMTVYLPMLSWEY